MRGFSRTRSCDEFSGRPRVVTGVRWTAGFSRSFSLISPKRTGVGMGQCKEFSIKYGFHLNPSQNYKKTHTHTNTPCCDHFCSTP